MAGIDSLSPDDKRDDRAGAARAGRAALTILRDQLDADDEALMQLAREVEAAWHQPFRGS